MSILDNYTNKIIHGDCLEITKDIPDNSIDLIITDPPYGIEYSSNGGPRVSKHRKDKIASETKIVGDEFINPLWFKEMFRVLKSGSAVYIFCNWDSYSEMRSYVNNVGFKLKTPIVWDKGNCGMGDLKGDYGNQTEIIIYAVKGRHKLNGGRDRNIVKCQRPADAYRLHPTQKPEDLISFLMKKSSFPGDIILDMFLGSGTTVNVCQSIDRKFIGIEKDKKYYDIAIQRIAECQS